MSDGMLHLRPIAHVIGGRAKPTDDPRDRSQAVIRIDGSRTARPTRYTELRSSYHAASAG